MKTSKIEKSRGRPRAFDAAEALDKALEVFWKRGYEGASISELTEAMGITRPSLYAAFGNKVDLFRKALDRYAERSTPVLTALEEPNAKEAIRAFLSRGLSGACPSQSNRGCLFVQGALACSEESDEIKKELITRRGTAECAIRQRLQLAKEAGELPEHVSPANLARFYATVSQGLSVQAASGARPEDLLAVIDAAMNAWPSV